MPTRSTRLIPGSSSKPLLFGLARARAPPLVHHATIGRGSIGQPAKRRRDEREVAQRASAAAPKVEAAPEQRARRRDRAQLSEQIGVALARLLVPAAAAQCVTSADHVS
jgi:hypothetical protein